VNLKRKQFQSSCISWAKTEPCTSHVTGTYTLPIHLHSGTQTCMRRNVSRFISSPASGNHTSCHSWGTNQLICVFFSSIHRIDFVKTNLFHVKFPRQCSCVPFFELIYLKEENVIFQLNNIVKLKYESNILIPVNNSFLFSPFYCRRWRTQLVSL